MPTAPLYVGVDVSKTQFDIAVHPSGERWTCAADDAQVATLVTRLQTLSPALIVLDIERCWRLPCGAEQLVQILAASNLVEAAKAIRAADASGLSSDRDWIKRTLEDLVPSADARPRLRSFERAPRE